MAIRVGVIGAAGLTGRRVVRRLAEAGVRVRAGGRRVASLRALDPGLDVRVAQVELFDPPSLDRFVDGLEVLVNCVGPFTQTGPPVVEACLRRGVHLLDLAGELPWAMDCADRYDGAARAVGVAICVAAGLEVAPLDCLLAMGVSALGGPQEAAGLSAMTAGWVSGFLPSQSSARSALRVAQTQGYARVAGGWRARQPGSTGRWVDFGGSLGRKFVGWMPTIEAATASWWAPEMTIEGHFCMPRWARPGVRLASRLARLELPGSRRLGDRLCAVLPPPRGGEPFAFLAEVRGRGGLWRGTFEGAGVYETTGMIVADTVVALLRDGPRIGRGGVMGPAMLLDFGAALDRWQQTGCVVEVSCSSGPGPDRR